MPSRMGIMTSRFGEKLGERWLLLRCRA